MKVRCFMGKKTRVLVQDQLKERLISQIAFGESRHEAKNYMTNNFERADGIYSHSTFNNYLQVVNQFCKWREEQGLGKYTNPETEFFQNQAVDYLKWREEQGYSAYTLHRDASALNRVLFGAGDERLDYTPPERNSKKIEKGRDPERKITPRNQFNRDVYDLARGTGLRRHELEQVRDTDFITRNERLYVRVRAGKGGKERIAPVLKEYEDKVKDIIERRKSPDKPLFDRKIHKRHNVHALRREYAQNLRNEVKDDKNFGRDLIDMYGDRKDVVPRERHVKSEMYNSTKYDVQESRDVVYTVSRALGHNRLDVVVIHYFN